MQREDLKTVIKKTIGYYSRKSFIELSKLEYPIVFEHKENDRKYDVEIQCLEITNEYVHIGVAVSSGGLSSYLPASGSFIIHKDGRVER